ncbi:unnamed protein product [Chrysoparadoxa australica]
MCPPISAPTTHTTTVMSAGKESTRLEFIKGAATLVGASLSVSLPSFAEEAEAPAAAPASSGIPTDWGISKTDYYSDASKVVSHMRYCTELEKGAPNIEKIGANCKKEMVDFVSFYRRFDDVNGKLSYSNLYTSINVLAGHYASYGTKFPVPEKRKKRLLVEYNDIEVSDSSKKTSKAHCRGQATQLLRTMPPLLTSYPLGIPACSNQSVDCAQCNCYELHTVSVSPIHSNAFPTLA